MKRILILGLLVLFHALDGLAKQEPYSDHLNVKGTLKSAYQEFPAGTPVTIRMVMRVSDNQQLETGVYYLTDIGDGNLLLPQSQLSNVKLTLPETTDEFWQQIYLAYHFYEQRHKANQRDDLRREVEEESQEYLEHLDDILYEDSYITSYVQGVLAGMCGDNITTTRNGNLNVRVVQAPDPLSFVLPSGNLIVSTGLLCTLDSEDELAAVLAGEISHYLFDHQMSNVRKAERRAQRAMFWANVFDVVAYELEEAYFYRGNERVLYASSLANVGSIISLLCFPAIDRLGMNYSNNQEQEADKLALRILEFNGYRAEALASALRKIRDYYTRNRETEDLMRYNDIDQLQERIGKLPETPQEAGSAPTDRPYLRTTYDAVNFNAALNYSGGLFKEAIMLARKNIANRLADSQTYLLLVQSQMALYNTDEVNAECLALLDEAEALPHSARNPEVCKQRILLLMRMKKQTDALHSLHDYMGLLIDYQKQQPADRQEQIWIDKEMNWTQQMMEKINKV